LDGILLYMLISDMFYESRSIFIVAAVSFFRDDPL